MSKINDDRFYQERPLPQQTCFSQNGDLQAYAATGNVAPNLYLLPLSVKDPTRSDAYALKRMSQMLAARDATAICQIEASDSSPQIRRPQDTSNAFAPLPENNFAPVKKKKKRGFFGRIGHALKKFAGSKFGKLLLIGGSIAASFFLPGIGPALTKLVGGLGKSLLGGLGKLGAQFGVKDLFSGGLKTFLKKELASRFEFEDGIKVGIENLIKRKLLSADSLQNIGRNILGRVQQSSIGRSGWMKTLTNVYTRIGSLWPDLLSGGPKPPIGTEQTWM